MKSIKKIQRRITKMFGDTAKTQKGFVYVIRQKNSDYYKVGFTRQKTVEKRLQDLQTANPIELLIYTYKEVSNPEKLESFCHDILGAYHVRNEWFNIPEDKAHQFKLWLLAQR